MFSHWTLSDSKFSQVSRTLLSILADLTNAVVWMVSTRPLISKSSSPFTNPLVNVLRVPIIIGITVPFMFHSFFPFPCKIRVLIFLFAFFQFYSVVSRENEVHISTSSLFLSLFFFLFFFFCFVLLIITRSGRLAEIRWSVCISKSQGSLRVSFSWTDYGLCVYHFVKYYYHHYYHYYYFSTSEIFTPVLTDGLSLESEWQQVSSRLRNSEEYSSWSQLCCSMYSHDLAIPQVSFLSFRVPVSRALILSWKIKIERICLLINVAVPYKKNRSERIGKFLQI